MEKKNPGNVVPSVVPRGTPGPPQVRISNVTLPGNEPSLTLSPQVDMCSTRDGKGSRARMWWGEQGVVDAREREARAERVASKAVARQVAALRSAMSALRQQQGLDLERLTQLAEEERARGKCVHL